MHWKSSRMLEEFFHLIGYYLVFILLSLVIGFSLFFFFSKKDNRSLKKIMASRSGLNFISSKLGLNLFDSSELADQFHARIDLAEDLYSKSLILMGGTAELDIESLKPLQSRQKELSWIVFPEAIVLKAHQNLFLGTSFLRLSNLLSSNRTSKPINSFVLNLSFDDLLDEEKLNLTIKQLPKFDNFIYPVYLILQDNSPQSEQKENESSKNLFAGLREILSAEELSRTIGWSDNPLNDFETTKYFLPNIDNTISAIMKHIIMGLKEIIYAKLSTFQHKKTEELILLLEQLPRTMSPGLKQFILNNFTYKKHYFLRGIYLSDGNNSISNLFFKTIFAEDFTNSVYQSKYNLHSLTFLRISLFISVITALYLFFLNKLLLTKAEKAEFAIEKIDYLLKRSEGQFEKIVAEFDLELKNARTNLPTFFPWSIFSNLKSRLYALFAISYNRLILSRIISSFNSFVKDLSQGKTKYIEIKVENPFFKANQFIELSRYISEVARMEGIESDLIEISKNSGMLNLVSIIKKLFNYELPSRLANNRKLYRAAFNYKLPGFEKIIDYTNILQKNLSNKIDFFYNLIGNPYGFFDQLELLSKNTRSIFQASTNYSLTDLDELKNSMELIIKIFSDIKFLFESDMPKDMQNLSNSLHNCLVFRKNSVSELNNGFIQAVEKLKTKLLELNLPIFGKIFSKNDQSMQLDSSFTACLEIIREFFQKSLELSSGTMSSAINVNTLSYGALFDSGEGDLRIPGLDSSIKEAEWNLDQLALLVSKISEFENFLANSLQKIPAINKIYISAILKNVFSKSVEQKLFESLIHKKPLYLDKQQVVDKMNKAISLILQIIAFLRKEGQMELAKKISSIVAVQIDFILDKLYARIKNIYGLEISQIGQRSMTDKQISQYLSSNKSKLKNAYFIIKELLNYGSLFEEFSGISVSSIKKWESIQELLEESNGIIGDFEASLVKVMSGESVTQLPKNEFVASQLQNGLKLSGIKMRQISQENLRLLYPSIQAKFYANLAGFFPFAPLVQPDLPIERMREFIAFWSENEQSINNILNSMAPTEQQPGGDKRQWYTFLLQMSLAVQWMRHLLDPEKYPASIEIIPMIARNIEKNSAQLISLRILLSGENLFAAQTFPEARMEIGSELKSPYLGHSRLDFGMQLVSQSKFQFQRAFRNKKFIGASYKGVFSVLRFIQANFYRMNDNGMIYLLVRQPISGNNQNLELAVSMGVKLSGLQYLNFPRFCPDMLE